MLDPTSVGHTHVKNHSTARDGIGEVDGCQQKARTVKHDEAIAERFKEERLAKTGDKPDPEDWAELIESDPDFVEELSRTFDNPDIKEAEDDFDPDSCDGCINMELPLWIVQERNRNWRE